MTFMRSGFSEDQPEVHECQLTSKSKPNDSRTSSRNFEDEVNRTITQRSSANGWMKPDWVDSLT